MKLKTYFTAIMSFLVFFFSFATVKAQEYTYEYFTSLGNSEEGALLILAIIGAVLLVLIPILIAIYIYTSLAYRAIAKKTKTKRSWLAWVPVGRYFLIADMAQMPWWPILLIIGFFIESASPIFQIAFSVFFVIWLWKIFERLGRPGWWALLIIIPFVGGIVFLVLLGIAAWGKQKNLPKKHPVKRIKTKRPKKRKK